MNKIGALEQYSKIDTQTAVVDADPHRLIQMLLNGALEQIAFANGHIQRGELEAKGNAIGKAAGIIGGLQSSLNHEVEGGLAARLEGLYDYMVRRLTHANYANDTAALDEVSQLLREIKAGWDAIRDQALEEFDAQTSDG